MWQSSLNPEESVALDALIARAAAVDGAAPLNEEARLTRNTGESRHLLAHDGDLLVGYLTHSPGYGTAQLVVDPGHRRRGIGSSLVAELARDARPRLWAFGDSPAAQGFARSLGLVPGRGLLIMGRELWTIPEPDPGHPPDGITLRTFRPSDAAGLLAVNAAAFAHHPEQGSLDAAGLAARMAEDWFDPAGLILAVEDGRIVGFHWTKRHGPDTGEVYVIGVHPAAQGRGLGRALLQAGLDHLSRVGCRRVILYVDSADGVAVQMYGAAGFHVLHRDVLYVPVPEELP